MAEPVDLNVDELRRRARRRLVGAVVLALGVAVIVPMLLETEQKPLGEDVSVRIPPIDDSKFVNRLSEKGAKTATKVPSQSAAAAARETPAADATPAAPAISGTSKYDTHVTDAPASGAAPAAASASHETSTADSASANPAGAANPKPPPPETHPFESAQSTAIPTVTSEPGRTATAPAVAPKPSLATAAHEGFAVQLAAFADDKGANSLAGRLKRAGYTAYTEPLKTSKGTLWRVRVGPYASHEAAVAARDRLKAEGQSGIVAAVK